MLAKLPLNVRIGRRKFPVCDLSGDGVGFVVPATVNPLSVGDQCALAIGAGDELFYRGAGQVLQVEPTAKGARVGLRVTDGSIDLGRIIDTYAEPSVRELLDNGHGGATTPEYRRLCGDTLSMLLRYRSILDPFERQVGGDGVAGRARLEEVYNACEGRFLDEWRELWHGSQATVTPFLSDLIASRAAKRFTESVLTPEMVPGPLVGRSYQKPLGYPGDYQVMEYIYDNKPEGHSAYATLLHKLGLDVGHFVKTRMDLVREAIATTVCQHAGESVVRITSVGCGPAREVIDYLSSGAPPAPVRFTLIDHEREALSHAAQRAQPVLARVAGRARIKTVNASVWELLREAKLFSRIRQQHMIYSVGLFDYFGDKRCQRLVAGLFKQLAPGGLLIIANMKAKTDVVWPLEFILDWTLNYRTAEDMVAFADLVDPASVELRTDPTGYTYLLSMRKKA